MALTRLLRSVLPALALAATPALAAGGEEGKVKFSLVSERSALVAGETGWLGVRFEIEKDWHIYWNGQSDAGGAPEITFELPAGFTAGDLVWPAPRRHLSDGPLLDHVYEKRAVLLLPVKVPADAAGKAVTIKASATWMVCKSACLVESGEASISLPVAGAGSTPKPTPEAPLLAAARERVPTPAPADGSVVRWEWKGQTLVVTSAKGKKIAFYPYENSAKLTDMAKDAASETGRLELRIKDPGPVRGIVEIEGSEGVRPMVHSLDVPPPGQNPRGGEASNPNSR